MQTCPHCESTQIQARHVGRKDWRSYRRRCRCGRRSRLRRWRGPDGGATVGMLAGPLGLFARRLAGALIGALSRWRWQHSRSKSR